MAATTTSSLLGIRAVTASQARTTFASGVRRGEAEQTELHDRGLTSSPSSPTGPFVDQDGVALLDGGSTLVLETHGSVVGPGGQDLMTDTDGVVMVYRKCS